MKKLVFFAEGTTPTLEEVLQTREKRALLENELVHRYQPAAVVSLKCNIPGPIKNNEAIRQLFSIGRDEIYRLLEEKNWKMLYRKELDLRTGPELLCAVEAPAEAVKQEMIRVEETSPLGRLYDIDVLYLENGRMQAVERTMLGHGARRCFICDRPAKECGRSRKHTVQEMLEKIESLIIEDGRVMGMANKVRFMDTVLRDGHQSLVATRMTTEQMVPILETLDQAGYFSLEVWGGATFDSCLRYLNEDPWERLRTIRKHVKNTKLQMLLRGQNLLGYKHYPDDVVESFIQKSLENGIDIIRVFDALNDLRNLETSVRAIKKYGGHCQLCICYTISEVHTNEYYVELAQKMEALGADSIAIKDMAGILTPANAYTLVKAIKQATRVPLEVHTHATSGISEMTYLKAVEAGADIIDTAISPFSGGTSQPATESVAIALNELGYDTGLDMEKLKEIAAYFRPIKEEFRQNGILNPKVMDVEPNTLLYQVPGGMLSNLLSQLKDARKEDKYEEVLQEIPRVRKDLGFPPLVTPLSQMVGTQAVMNIISGERYKMVPKEIKDYVKGLYGQSPAPIDEEVKHKIIGDEETLTIRPADLLQPMMAEYAKELKEMGDLAESTEDVLMYALFPNLAVPYLRKRKDPFYDVPVQNVTVVY